MTHRPRATCDEHALTRDTAIDGDGVIRGERGYSEAGSRSEVGSRRKRHRLGCRNYDVFRRRTVRTTPCGIPQPDALAESRSVDATAHPVDHAGSVAMRHDPWKRQHLRAHSGARLDVHRIDP